MVVSAAHTTGVDWNLRCKICDSYFDVPVYSRRKDTFKSQLCLYSHITTPLVMPQVSALPTSDPSSLGIFFPTFRNSIVVSYSGVLRPFDLCRWDHLAVSKCRETNNLWSNVIAQKNWYFVWMKPTDHLCPRVTVWEPDWVYSVKITLCSPTYRPTNANDLCKVKQYLYRPGQALWAVGNWGFQNF